jgi:hypothetical protein
MRASVYRKNIRQWEQWSRVVAGLVMLAAALAVPSTAGKVLLAVSGVGLAVTGVVGWCPACAMVGRRLESEASHAGR